MNSDIKSVLFNVIGGIIVSILSVVYMGMHHRFRLYHLQRLLGFQFRDRTEVRMTYGQFLLPPLTDQSGRTITHPYVKAPRRGGAMPLIGTFSMEHPISECEVRASTYIATLLGLSRNLQPLLLSDIEADSIVDSNFISFGGPGSNFKTADTLASEANIFVRMTNDRFLNLSGETFPFVCSREAAYGIILRITPPNFPMRSWIVCAGIGEWGTSGTAWFLVHRWTELVRRVHPVAYWSGIMHVPDFLAFIQVVPGQDQSARLIQLYRNDHGQSRRII